MTGYLPLTSVAAKAVEASAQYAKNPAYKTAFDQMKAAKATPNIRLRRVAFCKSSPRNHEGRAA